MLSAMAGDPELEAPRPLGSQPLRFARNASRLLRRASSQVRQGKLPLRRRRPEHLHTQFLLSVLSQGKVHSFHIPLEWAREARSQVELHKRFQQIAATICGINLRRLLRRKQQNQGRREEG